MKILKNTLVALIITLIAGCATLSEGDRLQLPITYGTLKVIERDNDIGAGDVINVVDKLNVFIKTEQTVTGSAIRSYVSGLEEWKELAPEDQYLISTLFSSVEETLQTRLQEKGFDNNDVKIKAGTYLQYVRTAATMY